MKKIVFILLLIFSLSNAYSATSNVMLTQADECENKTITFLIKDTKNIEGFKIIGTIKYKKLLMTPEKKVKLVFETKNEVEDALIVLRKNENIYNDVKVICNKD